MYKNIGFKGFYYAQFVHFLFLVISFFLVFDVFFKGYLSSVGFGVFQKALVLSVFLVQIFLVFFHGFIIFPKDLLLILSVSLLIGLLSSFNAGVPEAVIFQIFLTYQGFLVFFVFSNLAIRSRDAYSYLLFFVFLGGFVFIISVFELYNRELFYNIFHAYSNIHEQALKRGSYIAVQSVFEHPGLYSWFMAFNFSICCSLLLGKKRYLFAFMAIIFSIGVFISLRRKSMISLLFVFLFYVIFFQSRKNRNIFLFFGGCVLLLLVVFFYEQISYVINHGISHYLDGEYYSPRNILFFESISLANDYFPFGTGYGTYGSWMSRIYYSDLYVELGLNENYGMSEEHAIFLTDTYWPMIIAELGWFGLVSVIFLWVFLLCRLVNNFRLSGYQKNRIVHCAASLVLVQVLFESIASPALAKAPEMFFVMLLAGISCRLASKEKVVESNSVS